MKKALSLSLVVIAVMMVTPLSLLACHWLDGDLSSSATEAAVTVETRMSSEHAQAARFMQEPAHREALQNRHKGNYLEDAVLNPDPMAN